MDVDCAEFLTPFECYFKSEKFLIHHRVRQITVYDHLHNKSPLSHQKEVLELSHVEDSRRKATAYEGTTKSNTVSDPRSKKGSLLQLLLLHDITDVSVQPCHENCIHFGVCYP